MPSPQPSPAMRERESEMCSGQRAPRLQCTTKFDPVTRLARHASEPVTKLARNSKRPNQQAVMERVCDEKSGERRGDHLQMTTKVSACFRKIFAVQIPPSPQRDQARTDILKSPRRNVTEPGQTSSCQSSDAIYSIRFYDVVGISRRRQPFLRHHRRYLRSAMPTGATGKTCLWAIGSRR